jgi:beta-glucosidase
MSISFFFFLIYSRPFSHPPKMLMPLNVLLCSISFRWVDGFTNRFGLIYIDYKNASLPRFPKKSSHWYGDYARTHAVYDSEGHGSELVVVNNEGNASIEPDADEDQPVVIIEQPDATTFVWGVATAAYQIEGAVNDGGRGSTIWDTFSALPGKTDHGDTGELADGSYYRVKEDVQLIKDMGLKSYRFSIAWSRIMPTGQLPVNQVGVDHYNAVLDELERQGIEPLVTLYHWDLPSGLEDLYGGWLSPEIERDFVAYADVAFAAFGDRVKMWSTMNEPWTFCLFGYVTGLFAPGRCSDRSICTEGDSATEGYIAAHNVLNSHAAAVELYRTKYQSSQGGKIGIVLNQDWAEPLTDDPLDVAAAERKNEFTMAWFADPLVFGRYPESMVRLVGDRLPQFTPEQKVRITGSYDYFAINHYSTKYYYDPLRPLQEGEIRVEAPISAVVGVGADESSPSASRSLFDTSGNLGWPADQANKESKYDMHGQLIGPEAASSWLHVVPWGFHRTIMWNHFRYTVDGKRPVIYITENGCDVPGENDMTLDTVLDDTFRIEYYRLYLLEMERAMSDGVDIRGYYAWSLMDNYE